jgi:hypothetical protein
VVARAESILAPDAARPRPRRGEARALVTRTPPLVVELGSELLELDGQSYQAAVSASIFDFGVVSLRLGLQVAPKMAWADFVRFGAAVDTSAALAPLFDRLLHALLERIGGTITRPQVSGITEDYVVFRMRDLVSRAGAHCPPNDMPDMALTTLLLNEPRALSPDARRELLPHRFSYTDADFTVLTWDNALVVEPDAADRDIEYVLEFANAQLLEFRVFDAVLDAELPRMYQRVAAARKAPHLLLRRRFQPVLSDLQTLVADTTEIVERAENALKVTDDVYLARIYSATLQIFRGIAWRNGIDRKLGIIHATYAMLNAESQATRSEALEIAIIVLILTEIVLTLL